MIVVGTCWAVLGEEDRRNEVWKGIGGITILVGLIAFLIAFIRRSQKSQRRGSQTGVGGLVISPTGFALQQGDMKGIMRWDEIASVSFGERAQNITIRFAGGSLIVKDIFSAPSRKIYRLLVSYWKGPSHNFNE